MAVKYRPQGSHTRNTSLSAAVTLTPPAGTDALAIQALTQPIRYTLDGTTPTATVGFKVAAGDSDIIPIAAGVTVKVIEETASAEIQYQWLLWQGDD